MTELAQKILAGNTRSIARAISHVENDREGREALIDELYPHCGKAIVWGITGPPGAGKSSLVDRLIERLRTRGKSVAVIAVDPSSPFTGGALLGDRLRMQKHAVDDGVFIRSMASRGHLGGLAGATADALRIFDAAGFDYILVETIGVGQTEIEIMGLSDIVLLVLVPGAGDEIQALKAGVMEIGDIFIINKRDLDGADKLRVQVEYVLGIKFAEQSDQMNPILMTSAINDEGVDDLMDSIGEYVERMKASGKLANRREQRLQDEIKTILSAKIFAAFHDFMQMNGEIDTLVQEIVHDKQKPYALINAKIDVFIKEMHTK